MNAQQLRNSILQQAIQGKLVPQDPTDEPASVLLQRIRKEKERLVKEGKLKKKDLESKPIEEDEIPFEIPESWEWVKLGDVFELRSGQDFPPEKYNSNCKGIPYITGASNLDGDKIILNRWTETPSVIAPKGCLLLVCKGSGVGKLCFMSIEEAHIARQIQAIIPISENIDLSYLRIVLESRISEIINQANGVIPGIAREVALSFVIPLPPLAEQRRIVAKIEELMPLVERYGKAQQALDQLNESLPSRLRQSILQEAIQGRLVPQDPKEEPASELLKRIRKEKEQLVKEGKLKKKDLESKPIEEDEIPFEIPESWEWVRYKDIASCELGKTKNPNEPLENLCPYLCSINVYWNRIDLSKLKEMPFTEKEKEKYSIKKGDMLICEGGEAGRTAIWDDDATIVYYQNALHRVRFYSEIDPKFYMYQMHIYKTSGYLHDYINGETIQHFVLSKLQILPVPLPPLSEQKRIVAKVEELFGVMDSLSLCHKNQPLIH